MIKIFNNFRKSKRRTQAPHLHTMREMLEQNKKCLLFQEESLKLDAIRAEQNKDTKLAFTNYMMRASRALEDEAPLKKQKLMKQVRNQELESRERLLKIALMEKQLGIASTNKFDEEILSVEPVACGDHFDVDDDFGSARQQSPEELFEDPPDDADFALVPLELAPQVVEKPVPLQATQILSKSVPQQVTRIVKLLPQQVVVKSVPTVALKACVPSTAVAAGSTFVSQPHMPYINKKLPLVSEEKKGPAKCAMAILFGRK